MSRPDATIDRADPVKIKAGLDLLCREIGVRLAGSDDDRKTIAALEDGLSRCGATTHVEEFPLRARRVESEELAVNMGNGWESFGCSLFSNTPGTDGRWVEAPVEFFEAPAERSRGSLAHLRGKAVVHLGSHIPSREAYRNLIDAKPALLLFVDVRYPGTVPLADGMFPAYAFAVGAIPTLNVAYMDAWRWKREGAKVARVRVRGGMGPATSANVIADIPGRDAGEDLIVVSAHHDTQADSVGADDNGSGTAVVLELARLLGRSGGFRRPVRLISFGAEEQLSVGSSAHVRNNRADVSARTGFVFNVDSVGSHLGWFQLHANGPARMTSYVRRRLAGCGVHAEVSTAILPYADHFPFVACGVPAVTLMRKNCESGRFFHHRPDDDMDKVSVELLARVTDSVADTVVTLADLEELPFERKIPPAQMRSATECWEDLFGGWEPQARR